MSFPKPDPYGTCVITGASSGIGADMARILASKGYNVTLVARREDHLKPLSEELTTKHGVRAEYIVCDVTDPAGRDHLVAHVSQDDHKPLALINNAGFASSGDFINVEEAGLLGMIDTNVTALVSLTRRIVPLMIDAGGGAVLNTASTAAFQPMPHEATYAASKAFVLHFTEAIGHELRGTGVTCTTLCPGPTNTEFASVAGLQDELDALPGFLVSSPSAVAATGVTAMMRGRRTRTHGFINRVTAKLGRYSPRPIVLRVVDAVWPNTA